jgi:CheY-like chemotaxis protein
MVDSPSKHAPTGASSTPERNLLSGYFSVVFDKDAEEANIAGEILPRVLLVEDNFVICAAVEAHLLDEGFKVVTASRAADAVLKARTFKPDVIVMDIRLAGPADGIDAADAIYRASGTRSIFATAHYDPATRASAATAHPYAWVPKPYTPEDIAGTVRRMLADLSGGNS